MSATEMEFLKGAGKAFELSRLLASLVLARGGTEEHILQLLKRGTGLLLASQVADVLVGQSTIVERPAKEVLADKGATLAVRLVAFRQIVSVDLAVSLLKDNTEHDSELLNAAITVMRAPYADREQKLLEVALLPRRCVKEAVAYMSNQDNLLEVCRRGNYAEVRNAAAEKLDEDHLKLASDSVEFTPSVRFIVAQKVQDDATLRKLADDAVRSVRHEARRRLNCLVRSSSGPLICPNCGQNVTFVLEQDKLRDICPHCRSSLF